MITDESPTLTPSVEAQRDELKAQVERLTRARGDRSVKLIYIAGPFRGPHAWAIRENIHAAEQLAAEIVADGRAFPVTPHSIGANFHGHGTDVFWLEGTLEVMRRCDAVLALSSWQRSTGARAELAEAERLGIPVLHSLQQLQEWLGS